VRFQGRKKEKTTIPGDHRESTKRERLWFARHRTKKGIFIYGGKKKVDMIEKNIQNGNGGEKDHKKV